MSNKSSAVHFCGFQFSIKQKFSLLASYFLGYGTSYFEYVWIVGNAKVF